MMMQEAVSELLEGADEARQREILAALAPEMLWQFLEGLGGPVKVEVEVEPVAMPEQPGDVAVQYRSGATRLVISWPDPEPQLKPEEDPEERIRLTAKGAALVEFLKSGGSEADFCAGWDAAWACAADRGEEAGLPPPKAAVFYDRAHDMLTVSSNPGGDIQISGNMIRDIMGPAS